jgi:hypothetical protein
MTNEVIETTKPHKHSWKVTLDSKPLSKTDYHLMFIECDCGIKISITNACVSVYRNDKYLGGVLLIKENASA